MTFQKGERLLFFCNGFQHNITGAVKEVISSDGYFRQMQVISIATPLFKLDPRKFSVEAKYRPYKIPLKMRFPYPSPPVSYFLDPFFAFASIGCHIFLSFSPQVTFLAICLKRFGLVSNVVHWSIDYSPRRFKNPILEKIYRFFDKISFLQSDIHVDVSNPALEARSLNYGRGSVAKNLRRVVPVGIPDGDLEQIPATNFLLKRIFFLGNLTSTVGIDTFVMMCKQISIVEPDATFHVIGDGLEFDKSRTLSTELGIENKFEWYGNLDKEEFEPLLKTASIGLAPYKKCSDSFSVFADPSKIKNYAQFGIPFVMTDVPKISKDFINQKLGTIVSDSLDELARAVLGLMRNQELWNEQSAMIFEYAKSITWTTVMKEVIKDLRTLR